MTHTLLHQVLVSDLVVPIGLAETAEQASRTGSGPRLADNTWLRSDLLVFRKEQDAGDRGYIEGAPLLAIEVTSDASREVDLGAKKDMYERFAVPSYWVVDLKGDEPELQVFELSDDGRYAEEARVTWGRTCTITRPFAIELAPDQIFDRLPRPPAPRKGIHMSDQDHRTGPDLPHCEEPILIDAFGRWPTGAEKVELWDGCPVFYGAWDERDVEIAERAYPGRVIRLDQPPGEPGTLTVLPGPGVPEDSQAS
ncbi:Uma2 family endonuclease [Actinomadura rudentiformis]|uniref:Uma2 family endonuclease n=1 Tax=Actinomadura rudentiformis TaxID=359158 RepID=A0A6H9YX47_9ACTN|nr:Uma2 family endonuclease [Actinomadura rudentiformis]KAB2345611.1 Uma2 family endonuclease [Actinomadura rudentiformis]